MKPTKQSKKTKKSKGSANNATQNGYVVYKHPRGIPFPQRYRTVHRCSITGNIVAASSPGVFSAAGSSMYLPFSGGGWPGVLTASIATLMPAGFRNLCSSTGPYNNYRCYGSSFKMTMQPTALTDVITFTLTPFIAALGAPTGVSDALAEPRTKKAVAVGGAKSSTLNSNVSVANLYGVLESAIHDDVAGIFSAVYNAGPTQYIGWYVAWTTSTGGTNGAAIGYTAEMLFDVEYFNLNGGALLDT